LGEQVAGELFGAEEGAYLQQRRRAGSGGDLF
jgi:hypothetical protein